MPRNTTQYSLTKETFRSSSRKVLRKWGTNLQNIEKEARAMYVPDSGYIFVQTDQRGAEARIVAYLCEHGNYRELVLNGIKFHVFVALHTFTGQLQEELDERGLSNRINLSELCVIDIKNLKHHRDWKEVSKFIADTDYWIASKRYYYIAKMICHASNYGMRSSAFQLNVLEKSKGKIALSKKQAEYYLMTYHGLFPEIHAWHREIEAQLNETQMLFNLFGYPREFFYPMQNPSDHILKQAYAFIPQSTVGCITHIAYTELYKYIETNKKSWDLLANTHDSYLVQCPIGEEKECSIIMQKFMNQDLLSPRGEKFNMESDTQVGYNWGPYKSGKNDNGLKEI